MVIIFYLVILVPALLVATLRNPIHAILALLLVFFDLAVLLFCLEAEFLALLLLIVYLGAIAVLFLFVVMMMNISAPNYSRRPLPLLDKIVTLAGTLGVSSVIWKVNTSNFDLPRSFDFMLYSAVRNSSDVYGDYVASFNSFHNIQYLAQIMYSYNFLAFFLTGLVLLVAMVGSIALTIYHSEDMKRQLIFEQLEHSYSESLRLNNVRT
jgi:NADH-quinone oxidoreductase subunit J